MCSVKRLLAIFGAGMMALCSFAQKTDINHYITMSLGAGEANNLGASKTIMHMPGAGGNFGIGYELQAGAFIFGLGVQVDYQYRLDTVAEFMESDARTDIEGEQYTLEYVYQRYRNREHGMRIGVPVYVGGNLGEYGYIIAGANIQFGMTQHYTADAYMYPQGNYSWSIEPLRTADGNHFEQYGFYPEAEYKYSGTYNIPLTVAAMLEGGAYLPVKGKHRLRLGAYVNYGLPVGSWQSEALTDYSAVDINPSTQNQADLQKNLRLNPLSNANLYTHAPHNLEVGIRFTALFNVNVTKKICMCLQD